MMQFTKVQLIAKLQHRLTVAAKYPDVEEAELDAAIFQIALTSLTAEPVLYAAEETLAYANMGELHLTCLSEPMGDAVIPLYTAPPAPVAPVVPDCFQNAVAALESLYRNGQKQNWNERYSTDMAYASGVLNACRAAMLQGADVTLTNEGNKQSDELVMWIKRLAHSLRKVKPDSKLQSDAMDYLRRKGLISVEDALR